MKRKTKRRRLNVQKKQRRRGSSERLRTTTNKQNEFTNNLNNERMDYTSSDEPEPVDDEIEYEVEAILDWKFVDEGDQLNRLYKVHWKGFDVEDETWEPEENLANSKEILREFLAQNYLLSSILEGEVSNNEGEGAEDNERKIQVADKNENEEHISQTKSKASEDKDACNGTEICKFQAKYEKAVINGIDCDGDIMDDIFHFQSESVACIASPSFIDEKGRNDHTQLNEDKMTAKIRDKQQTTTYYDCKICGNRYEYMCKARNHVSEKHPNVECISLSIAHVTNHIRWKNPRSSYSTSSNKRTISHAKICSFKRVDASIEAIGDKIESQKQYNSSSMSQNLITSQVAEANEPIDIVVDVVGGDAQDESTSFKFSSGESAKYMPRSGPTIDNLTDRHFVDSPSKSQKDMQINANGKSALSSCKICGKRYTHESTITHIRKKHPEVNDASMAIIIIKPIRCKNSECPYNTLWRKSMYTHAKCCPFNKDSLETSQQIHTEYGNGLRDEDYQAGQKVPIAKTSEAVRTPPMPATCTICDKVLAAYETMFLHVRYHHRIEHPKAYIRGTFGFCDYPNCNYKTMRRGDYVKHVKNIHLKNARLENSNNIPEYNDEKFVDVVGLHDEPDIKHSLYLPSSSTIATTACSPAHLGIETESTLDDLEVNIVDGDDESAIVDVIGLCEARITPVQSDIEVIEVSSGTQTQPQLSVSTSKISANTTYSNSSSIQRRPHLPPLPFVTLAALALKNGHRYSLPRSTDSGNCTNVETIGLLTTSEICIFICEHFPYYRIIDEMTEKFERVLLASSSDWFESRLVYKRGSQIATASLWFLNPSKLVDIFMSLDILMLRDRQKITDSLANPESFMRLKNGTLGLPNCLSVTLWKNQKSALITKNSQIMMPPPQSSTFATSSRMSGNSKLAKCSEYMAPAEYTNVRTRSEKSDEQELITID